MGMPTPSKPVTTALGATLRSKRAGRALESLAPEIGTTSATLSRLERGAHRPSWDTAVALAAWLGWTPGQVMDAAATPAGDNTP
jgi:DNA-binding XRE family transcriptional regulator